MASMSVILTVRMPDGYSMSIQRRFLNLPDIYSLFAKEHCLPKSSMPLVWS